MTTSRDARHQFVLVALDGSPAAATALPVARAIAAQLGARVRVLHVAPARVPLAVLQQRLHVEEMEDADIHLHLGEPVAGILQMIEDPSVVLTVLTTHGRTVEPGPRLGRVAEAVIASTTRPILLIRPEVAPVSEPQLWMSRCLLFPLDGTPTTSTALKPAAELAGWLGASVDLLYVASHDREVPLEPGSFGAPRYVDQPQYEWPEWADEVVQRVSVCAQCPPEVTVRMFLSEGAIDSEIVRFASEHREDMVVLVRRSKLEPGRARVLRAVLEQTPVPVLLMGTARADIVALESAIQHRSLMVHHEQ